MLHAQRRLPKQVQQAEQPHVIGGDDVLSNPLLDHLAGPMRLWRRRALVAGWEFCFFSDSRPSDSQRLDGGQVHLLIHLRSRRFFREARSCGLRPLWLAMRSAVAAWRLMGQ